MYSIARKYKEITNLNCCSKFKIQIFLLGYNFIQDMFIKRDLRKISIILSDKSSDKETLKFSSRKEEFEGSVKTLCCESHLSAFAELKTLNLYANDIRNLQGIGVLCRTPIEELNLGNNKIASLPLEFGSISSLKQLNLDDNEIQEFPFVLCQLRSLVILRLSGNLIRQIPQSIQNLDNLEILVIISDRSFLI
jgi:Leucine-rich repeat (LRR) protein